MHTHCSPLTTVKVSEESWSPFTFAAYLFTVGEKALTWPDNGARQSSMLYSYFLQCWKASNVFTRHVLRETNQTDTHIHLLPSLLPNKWLCPGLSFPWLSLLIKVMLMDNTNGKMHLLSIGLAVNRENVQKCLITNCRLCSSFGAVILQHLD